MIRAFDSQRDLDSLKRCFIELQDFERVYDSRMPAGVDIATACIASLLERCKREDGEIFVADVDGEIAGYISVFARVRTEVLHDGDYEYAKIGDLVVIQRFRKRGLGKGLLEAAETYAKTRGARWLRVGVLAENRRALSLYESVGYGASYTELEKAL